MNSPYIDVGSTVTLRTTVRNQGSGESDATTLRYYRSTDSTAGISGATEVGTASVGALAAGGSSYLPIDLTPPLVADTYYFVACADAVSDESDTTNNCSYWSSCNGGSTGPDGQCLQRWRQLGGGRVPSR